MSGHNKWSKIHRKKEIQDQKKGGLFTKLGRNITIAVKKGGSGDPETNFALRLAIEKARAANMPKDNIQRAIKRGLGKNGEGEMIELTLEGYGPEGVAVIVEAITDNRNRTVAEVKNVFDKAGGSLAEPGAVRYQFERRGLIKCGSRLSEDLVLELIDFGVNDVEFEGEKSFLVTEPEAVKQVVQFLRDKGIEDIEVELAYLPKMEKRVEKKAVVIGFLERLREMEDVQEVYANIPS